MTPGRLKIWNDAAGEWEYTPGGGSQPIKVVRLPIAFDTPDILTGVTLYTPTPGDIVLDDSCVVVTTEWDQVARLRLFSQGEGGDPSADLIGYSSLAAPSGTEGGHRLQLLQFGAVYILASSGVNEDLVDASPLVAVVDDGDGGPTGATYGECEVVLLIVAAS